MGKKSKYPKYSSGTISVNGEEKASTYKNKNNVITNYNMSAGEKKAFDYAQKSFADSLAKVNVFDNATKKNLQAQIDAYTKNGQKVIENVYTPMLTDLKNDIASRFGNFDNSVFMDNLNSIEANRAEAMSGLAQDITAKQSELVNNELANRYTYLNFLQDVQNQINSNMFAYIGATQQNSTLGNNYNNQAYTAQQNAYNNRLNAYANMASAITNGVKTFSSLK